ncbi:transposase [Alkaliphilus flagellatus]|uniref:transposase n=1 Tax=Alkaliphilus flagellatus TaxID=2841507 RepID=UPI002ED1A1B8
MKEKGYEGSSSLVRNFIDEFRKGKGNELGILKEKVLRRTLISLLYKEIDSVKDITKKQLDKALNVYPELKIIYDIAKDFKALLFSKREFDLESWMERAKTLNIKELNSFISGIKRDLEAVKSSIKYGFSNGLAEGTVNKIKVIKRIMYGRCSFEMLRKKVLLQNFN